MANNGESTNAIGLSERVKEIEVLIRARYPVIYIVTWEEERAIEALAEIARRREKKLMLWSVSRGILPYGTPPESKKREAALCDPSNALDHVMESNENAIYVFRDLHPFLTNVTCNIGHIRRVRELSQYLKNSYKTLVIIAPTLQLPLDLQKDVSVIEFDMPSNDERGALMDRTLAEVNEATGRNLQVDATTRSTILAATSGLTLNEAENVFAKTLVISGKLSDDDLPIILSEKEQAIRKSGTLEYYHADAQMQDIGGMDLLKDWLSKRRIAFDPRAQQYGLPAPRGLLMIGVQGCGKSLTAKAIASYWRLPLLRLDVGRLFNSLVGSSEENVRSAIRVAESVAPAVLWVDEIEKSMAGSQSSGSTDGGTSARVLSTFLTWLQEKTSPVFVVATANSIDQLPPELLRRGRLDETFFVDLPDAKEREDIWRIHLIKRGRKVENFDLPQLSAATEGFSGAEIEQVVVAGLFESFGNRKPLTTEMLVECAHASVPLSRTMKEPIDRLRDWAEGRARRASSGHVAPIQEFIPRRRLEIEELPGAPIASAPAAGKPAPPGGAAPSRFAVINEMPPQVVSASRDEEGEFMSVCFVVIPVVVGSWPAISAAIVAAGAAMGYSAVTTAEKNVNGIAGMGSSEHSISLTMPDSQVVADALLRGEAFSLEKEGVIATFRVDGRGACQVHLSGTDKTDAELEQIGAQLMDRVRQQFAYAKVMQEMEERGFQVTGQEVEQNNTIRIRVQRM